MVKYVGFFIFFIFNILALLVAFDTFNHFSVLEISPLASNTILCPLPHWLLLLGLFFVLLSLKCVSIALFLFHLHVCMVTAHLISCSAESPSVAVLCSLPLLSRPDVF